MLLQILRTSEMRTAKFAMKCKQEDLLKMLTETYIDGETEL